MNTKNLELYINRNKKKRKGARQGRHEGRQVQISAHKQKILWAPTAYRRVRASRSERERAGVIPRLHTTVARRSLARSLLLGATRRPIFLELARSLPSLFLSSIRLARAARLLSHPTPVYICAHVTCTLRALRLNLSL